MKTDLKAILDRLNSYCKTALEAASGNCVSRSNYEVSIDHFLLQLLENPRSDIHLILQHFDQDPGAWASYLNRELEAMKSGNPGKPVFSNGLMRWIEDAWLVTSLELGQNQIRSASLLMSLANNATAYGVADLPGIKHVKSDVIKSEIASVMEVSSESSEQMGAGPSQAARSGESALSQFTVNFTEKARAGQIDPVFGRDREIRQIVDILGRRRKNNPIAVGDPGVGKTAVVEGLALKVAEGDVPDLLKNVDIVGLDLGLLEAGASVKGEFEKRLNAVITEIKSSEKPMILFIDEAHTLIGAGGGAGTNDAANLLKPALARGELRTIAATTWAEYKKYFEKDAALDRRFQLVKLDAPSVEQACTILRGIRPIYEKAHGVYVSDAAVVAAAELSDRYISGRQLPDKAVDLLDTACARVKISLATKPGVLEDLERQVSVLQREFDALQRDVDSGRSTDGERLQAIQQTIDTLEVEQRAIQERWKTESNAVDALIRARDAADTADDKSAARAAVDEAIAKLEALHGGEPLIAHEVTDAVVAQVVADWTGVPLGSLVKDEAASLLSFNQELKNWVIGQDHVVDAVDSGIRTSKTGLQNPDRPLGIFLFVGPSGVGKTETATGVANLMFGGDRFMVTLNMSEYQEKHTISRMVGSPAGYVGYGEGGVLTEAVRQRPYSVVLLDEVEKADLEVMNLFYQVFDKGTLSDGEGRVIDFRNTIVFLTSNLASDIIMDKCADGATPTHKELIEAIRPELQRHFKPALLARMTIVPFLPLRGDNLRAIVELKLQKVKKRLLSSQRLKMNYSDQVVSTIADRCTDIESGAREIDHIINGSLLPYLSTEILLRVGDESEATRLDLDIASDGKFTAVFS